MKQNETPRSDRRVGTRSFQPLAELDRALDRSTAQSLREVMKNICSRDDELRSVVQQLLTHHTLHDQGGEVPEAAASKSHSRTKSTENENVHIQKPDARKTRLPNSNG